MIGYFAYLNELLISIAWIPGGIGIYFLGAATVHFAKEENKIISLN